MIQIKLITFCFHYNPPNCFFVTRFSHMTLIFIRCRKKIVYIWKSFHLLRRFPVGCSCLLIVTTLRSLTSFRCPLCVHVLMPRYWCMVILLFIRMVLCALHCILALSTWHLVKYNRKQAASIFRPSYVPAIFNSYLPTVPWFVDFFVVLKRPTLTPCRSLIVRNSKLRSTVVRETCSLNRSITAAACDWSIRSPCYPIEWLICKKSIFVLDTRLLWL